MGFTSLLSDWGHEMATAILPAFLAVIGAPAADPAAIEVGVLWTAVSPATAFTYAAVAMAAGAVAIARAR
jgi:hypothetical protein